ncbi:hypothetical protein K8T06_00360 [bacterium]|nr:hypothetical protein [bacterium]
MQYREMKRSFFIGAWMSAMLASCAMYPPILPEGVPRGYVEFYSCPGGNTIVELGLWSIWEFDG